MLINFTNHFSSEWTEDQKKAAFLYGLVKDYPFPVIDPLLTESEIEVLGKTYVDKIEKIIAGEKAKSAVHIMGEMTFCYYVISRLKFAGIKCIASTTTREVTTDGSLKLTEFKFVRFREYF